MELMSSKAAAEYLGIALSTLWEWRNRSIVNLPYYKISPRKFMYRKEDLDKFLEDSRITFDENISDERILELTQLQECNKSALNYLLNLNAFCSIANRKKHSI
jgi:hypothetical protein